MANLTIREIDNGIVFIAKIVPGSSPPTRISGILDGMLKIKITAAPEKGKANQCLIKFLADYLDMKKIQSVLSPDKQIPLNRYKSSGFQKTHL